MNELSSVTPPQNQLPPGIQEIRGFLARSYKTGSLDVDRPVPIENLG